MLLGLGSGCGLSSQAYRGLSNKVPVNIVGSYYDLTGWTLIGASAVLNQVGISGEENTASIITDASTSVTGRVVSPTIANVPAGNHCWRMWIKKDIAATGYIPELQVVVDGSFLRVLEISLPDGGIFSDANSYAIRDGDECGYVGWWVVAINYRTTTTTSLAIRVFPARRLLLADAPSNTAVGSVIIGKVDILTNIGVQQALSYV